MIASAAKFLIEGGDDEAANVLLSRRIEDASTWDERYAVGVVTKCSVALRGPREAYEIMKDWNSEASRQIRCDIERAFGAVLPHEVSLDHISIRAEVMELDPDWHAELLELARGNSIHNQAADADRATTWQGLRFRSVTETRIAAALDRAGVLFLPLCKARLNGPQGRVNREPDFLVRKDGKWGIFEVDGEPYHPPQRTVHDHERDRLFQRHGIRLAQHYDSTDCYVTPDKVVAEFLALLERAY